MLKYATLFLAALTLQAATVITATGPSVKSYGAVGNGVHDDLGAINAAIAAAKASGQRYLVLPYGTYGVSKPLTIPNKFQLYGLGRGDAGGVNTVIKALASFPPGSTVVHMGDQNPSFGVQVQNLTIDGSGIAGACLENHQAEELSWGRDLLLTNCTGASLWVYGYGAQNSGPFEDLEIYPAGTTSRITPQTTCITVEGVVAFRGIESVTCNGGSGPVQPNIGIQLDFQGRYSDFHVEHFATAMQLGNAAGSADGMTVQNMEFGPSVQTGLIISSNPGNQNITLMGMQCAGCSALLVDQIMQTVDTHTSLGVYALGDGAGNSKTVFSNGQNVP